MNFDSYCSGQEGDDFGLGQGSRRLGRSGTVGYAFGVQMVILWEIVSKTFSRISTAVGAQVPHIKWHSICLRPMPTLPYT